jgi:alpha-2-macroglobulin
MDIIMQRLTLVTIFSLVLLGCNSSSEQSDKEQAGKTPATNSELNLSLESTSTEQGQVGQTRGEQYSSLPSHESIVENETKQSVNQPEPAKNVEVNYLHKRSVKKAASDHMQPLPSYSPEQAQLKSWEKDYAQTPFRVLAIAEQSWDDAPAIVISFSMPIAPETNLNRYVFVKDYKGLPVKVNWILNQTGTMAIWPWVKPDTKYTIEVSTQIKSFNNRYASNRMKKNITTNRLQRQVSFASKGSQLSPEVSEGLIIQSVNVAAVDIDFWKIKPEFMAQFAQRQIGGYIYGLESIKSQADIAYSGRYDIAALDNQHKQSVIPLNKALYEPGVYFAVMKGAGDYPYDYEVTWFTVSSIGIHHRIYQQHQQIMVNHVVTGLPIANALIEILDNQSKLLLSTKTDQSGQAQISAALKKARLITVRDGANFSILKLNQPTLDLTEFGLESRKQLAVEMFLYGPRDLYRPNEKVLVNGILRDNDGRQIAVNQVKAKFIQPDGKVFKTFNWTSAGAGFFSTELKLDSDAKRGDWRLEVTANQKDKIYYHFKVEDFLPERMALELSSESLIHLGNNTSKNITVQGDYLYGAPAAGNRVQADLRLRQSRSLSEKYPEFIFGREQDKKYDQVIKMKEQQTDDTGKAVLDIDSLYSSKVAQSQFPLRIQTTVNLLESGGRPVTRTLSQTVWPEPNMVGIRPIWDGDIALPNTLAEFELLTIDKEQQLQATEFAQIEVIRVNNHYYWQWDNDWSRGNAPKEIAIYSRVVSWKAGEKFRFSLPVEWGNYRIELKNKQGDIQNSFAFFAGWQWQSARANQGERPDQVGLSWDKGEYQAGDTALLSIHAEDAGSAIVAIESDQLLWAKQVSLKPGDNAIEIPVSYHWVRHDTYASVMLIRSADIDQKRLPKRSMGLIHLPLERSHLQLDVTIDVPTRVMPESVLTAKVQVNGLIGSVNTQQSEQKEAYVTLAAVDTGILNISNFVTPKPWAFFYGPRQYQVQLRDSYGKLIEQTTDRRAIQRFGGDAKLKRGGNEMQSEVQIVALFSGLVALDSAGQAQIDLQLPYFNGELRLMAVAMHQNQFGHGEQKVKVAAPIVAEINMPKYLAYQDRSMAIIDLQNMTDAAAVLDVVVQADHALNSQQISQSITLQPKQKTSMQLPIEATTFEGRGTVRIQVEQQAAGIKAKDLAGQALVSIDREWGLPIRPLYPPMWSEVSLVLEPGSEHAIDDSIFDDLILDETVARLTVSTKPPFDSQQHLSSLFQYPYGCLEQTTSRLWPLLLANDIEFQQFLSKHPRHKLSNKSDAIASGIGRISGMQRSNGSFGLWSKSSPEHHWLTVFATDALLKAKTLGYPVDESMLAKALKRLQAYVNKRGKLYSENNIYSADRGHYSFAYKAYAALVLARIKQVRLSDLRWLYDNKASTSKNKVAVAQLALALEVAGDPNYATKAWNRALLLDSEVNFYGGDYTSQVRDLAWTSELTMQSKLAESGLSLIKPLTDALISRRWLSTQERFALYRLAKQLEVQPGGNVHFNLATTNRETSNRSTNTITQAQDFVQTYAGMDMPQSLVLSAQADKGAQFAKFEVQGFESSMPLPSQDGMTVQRSFYNLAGQEQSISELKTGDWVLVHIELDSKDKKRIPDALVVDYLPAGLEIENQNLAHSRKINQLKIDGKTIDTWQKQTRIVHQEYQDDRYIAAVELDGYRMAHIFYLAKAVTPGVYQVGPVQVEDMVRPELRAVSDTPKLMTITIN